MSDDILSTTNDEIIDLDDVEGHGLREVAAGLGAAAVLAGGGSAALASSGVSLPAVHPSGPTITTQVSDPVTTVDKAVDQAISDVRGARDGALTTATNLAGDAGTLAGNAVTGAEGVAGSTVSYVNQDIEAAKTIAGGITDWAGATAGGTASGALGTAREVGTTVGQTANGAKDGVTSLATSAVGGAESTVNAQVQDAGRKAATILTATTTTVNNGITTVTTVLKSPKLDAGTDMSQQRMWMTASVDGVVFAQWEAEGSTSTATIQTPVGATHFTVSALGNDVLSAAKTMVQLA